MEDLKFDEITNEEIPEIGENTSINDNSSFANEITPLEDFGSVGEARVKSLKDSVIEIEEMIKERNDLSGQFIREGEKMKQSINNFLLENSPKGEDDSEFARERAELRKKQIEISELQLNEKVGCWRDISLLKRELRDQHRQINERENRAEMLGRILEE
jgi:vacuolar-type H+-ATPase subunit I/STV1